MFAKLKALYYVWQVIKDPTKTDELLKVGNQKTLSDPNAFKESLEIAYADTKALKLIKNRYEAPKLDLNNLQKLPRNTLGFQYAQHMLKNKLDPNFYIPIEGDSDISYIRTRYRKTHDFYHVLTGFDTTPMGELGVISFTLGQIRGSFGLVIIGLFFLHHALFQQNSVGKVMNHLVLGWHMGNETKLLLGYKLEELLHRDIDELRQELNIAKVPSNKSFSTFEPLVEMGH